MAKRLSKPFFKNECRAVFKDGFVLLVHISTGITVKSKTDKTSLDASRKELKTLIDKYRGVNAEANS
jgi:hypothetical protein